MVITRMLLSSHSISDVLVNYVILLVIEEPLYTETFISAELQRSEDHLSCILEGEVHSNL